MQRVQRVSVWNRLIGAWSVSLLFLALSYASAPAQTLDGPPGLARDMVRDVLVNVVHAVVDLRPQTERSRLTNTTIRIVRGGPFPGPMAGKLDGKRVILLPEIFVVNLWKLSEAQIFALEYGKPHFPERWLNQTLWRSPLFGSTSFGPFYDGPAPTPPLEYSALPPDLAESFRMKFSRTVARLTNGALIDVLLHELAHHALDNLYKPGSTSPVDARMAEARSDQWATEQFSRFVERTPTAGIRDKKNVAGRMLALTLIREMERWRSLSGLEVPHTHPNYTSRLLSSLDNAECEADDQSIESLCDYIRKVSEDWEVNTGAVAEYERRADEGEGFAHYRLGQVLSGRGEYLEACVRFRNAMNSDWKDSRVLLAVAWCHEHGRYTNGEVREDSLMVAASLYKLAVKLGWASEGNAGLTRIDSLQ